MLYSGFASDSYDCGNIAHIEQHKANRIKEHWHLSVSNVLFSLASPRSLRLSILEW